MKQWEWMSSILLLWICKSSIISVTGDQPHDTRQGQWEVQTCPGPLLEFCAQHPDCTGHWWRSRGTRKSAHSVSEQISPSGEPPWEIASNLGPWGWSPGPQISHRGILGYWDPVTKEVTHLCCLTQKLTLPSCLLPANRFSGNSRHWDLGDSRAEPSVTGRPDMTVLLIGKGKASRPPTLLSRSAPSATQHLRLQEKLSGWVKETSQFLQLVSLWKHRATGERRCYGGRTQKFILMPCFLPLFLLCMFSVGAVFTLGHLWKDTLMTRRITLCVTIIPALHPNIVSHEASSLPLLLFFHFFPLLFFQL